jgi:hypothetical protein
MVRNDRLQFVEEEQRELGQEFPLVGYSLKEVIAQRQFLFERYIYSGHPSSISTGI